MIINQLKISADKLTIANRSGLVSDEEIKLIRKKVCRMFKVGESDIEKIIVLKKSIDARKKHNLCLIYNVDVLLKNERKTTETNNPFEPMAEGIVPDKLKGKIVVVGAGPAGLFCTYILALNGLNPVLIEQGSDMNERIRQTEEFWRDCSKLGEFSNVVFGEGGAGTFSDGKLNTNVKDKSGMIAYVKKVFVEHGAPEEITYLDKPHIGTDKLREVIVNIRNDINKMGGKVFFNTYMQDIITNDNNISKICVMDTLTGKESQIKCDKLVLAIGHSARKTYEKLKGVLKMQQKEFAMGLRVQHKQEDIDRAQYGEYAKLLPHADYKLRYHTEKGRAVYSFCMCPGGYVVNTSTENGRTVVNGMSYHDRAGENANSAIVVNVTRDDLGNDDVMAGVEFQRKWEECAYQLAKGKIPVQKYGDFKKKAATIQAGSINVLVKGEYAFGDLNSALPGFVSEAIVEAMEYFGGVIEGYANDDVILCGVETRTSSPVRIVRDKTMQANIRGVYPCGEGAGYAGGIMSAAVDGIKVAKQIMLTDMYN